uniref:Ferritin n=1 Tax=Zonotrichia albicollis TaxID=44394 RepID=A0A8D2NCY1_ZONAL
MKYQQERGGHYCSKTIQKPNCDYAVGLMKALELAMVQWKTMLRYFEELYALSVENADPHSASTIKKQFIGPKIQKIKLMGDLLTNARSHTPCICTSKAVPKQSNHTTWDSSE